MSTELNLKSPSLLIINPTTQLQTNKTSPTSPENLNPTKKLIYSNHVNPFASNHRSNVSLPFKKYSKHKNLSSFNRKSFISDINFRRFNKFNKISKSNKLNNKFNNYKNNLNKFIKLSNNNKSNRLNNKSSNSLSKVNRARRSRNCNNKYNY